MAEVIAAVRAQGMASLDQVEAVVLETDGSVTVVGPNEHGPPSALADVPGADRPTSSSDPIDGSVASRPSAPARAMHAGRD